MCWRKETRQKPNMTKGDIPAENLTAVPDFPPPPHSPTLQEILPKRQKILILLGFSLSD